jgi:UDP-2,4-diacetamido-2,4,6-trideoxy-beta-L-altropyranose hydrolase
VKVAFRVDASPLIGSGHLMRCLTLAAVLEQKGAEITFLNRALPAYYQKLITDRGYQLKLLLGWNDTFESGLCHAAWLGANPIDDAHQSLVIINDVQPDYLIIDHYAIDVTWEKIIKPHVKGILVIDDLADREHDCDYLLDQNFYLNASDRYQGKLPSNCQQLLGPKYCLLRPEFLASRAGIGDFRHEVTNILIFFGGVDNDNYTAMAVDALGLLVDKSIKVKVVVGIAYPFYERLKRRCDALGFTCLRQVDNIAQLMSEADLAIAAGGSATWERCCLGLPSVVLSVAENQDELVESAAIQGLIYKVEKLNLEANKLSWHIQLLIENSPLRQLLFNNGLQLVKGNGANKVCDLLLPHQLKVRCATNADSGLLFEWRNSPKIRAVSASKHPVELASHQAWLDRVISSADKELIIIETLTSPVAVIRYDLSQAQAVVSIYLVPGMENKGLGQAALAFSETWIRDLHPEIKDIRALVLTDNIPSHQLFINSGYKKIETWYSKFI